MEKPEWFTAGDVDGFFGLFFSGFPDLLLIVGLAPVCGFPLSFVASRILPGAAISILAGIFSTHGRRGGWRKEKAAATLPRSPSASIHPPSLPTSSSSWARSTSGHTMQTWPGTRASSPACLAASCKLRAPSVPIGYAATHLAPRCCLHWPDLPWPIFAWALSSACFEQAAIALLPMLVLLTLYGSHLKLPFRLPPALLAIGIGAILVAVLRWLHVYTVPMPAVPAVKLYLPHAVNIFALFRHRDSGLTWRLLCPSRRSTRWRR